MSWQIDFSHSHITFNVRHMMLSKVRGEFERFSGAIAFNPDATEQTTVDVTIEAASINTRNGDRDNHLRSADFLNAEQYPAITFKSTRVVAETPNRGKLIGDLTIRDVTREVTLDVEYAGLSKSPWGTVSSGFTATTSINRKDWGLVWNVALETGGWLVGETINIELEIELVQVGELQPA